VSLDDYLSRIAKDQTKIFYITADTFNAAKNSPHLELFRKKGIEVLLLSDKIDEWVVTHLTEYEGKQLQSVAKGEIDIGGEETTEAKEQQQKATEEFASIIEHMKKVLGEKVADVKTSKRLTDSPACLIAANEYAMSGHLQRIMKAAGQDIPAPKPVLEINPDHKLVQHLKQETDDERFAKWTELLFSQAILAEGGQLDDPATFVKNMNLLFMELTN
jgi:molecular chaperone HtpG